MEFVLAIIGGLAAMITLVLAFTTSWRYIRQHAVILDIQDPTKAVTKSRLSFEDVRRGLLTLTEDARLFDPDFIFGINRGGALVGGYIAKQLKIPIVYPLAVNSDLPPDKRVIEHRCDDTTITGKVLLTDDAIRKGEHMREADEYVRSKYPGIILRRVVLLEMRVPHPGPETRTFRSVPIEKAAFFTTSSSVILPWDPEQS